MLTNYKNTNLLLWALMLITLLSALPARGQSSDTLKYRPGVAIRTNLLWDGLAEPNIGFEIPLGEHWSLGANAGLKPWPRWLAWDYDYVSNPTQWRNLTVVPELRYYPKQVYEGWLFGLDLLYSHFNMGSIAFPFGMYPLLKENRLQGDLYGLGLFAGYSWWLGTRFRLEVEAGAAVGYYNAGKYGCSHCDGLEGMVQGVTVIPKLGLNLAWNLRPRYKVRKEKASKADDTLPVPWTDPEAGKYESVK